MRRSPFSDPGGKVLLLLIALVVSLAHAFAGPAAEPRLGLNAATNQVGKYQRIDFSLKVSGNWTNPFNPDDIDVHLQLTTPSGQTITVPCFWCQPYQHDPHAPADWLYPLGPACWQARFSPAELGTYQAVARLKDPQGSTRSGAVQFRCLPSASKGFLRVSTKDSRFLEFSEGQPFFAIGQNLAFIGSQQYVTLSKAEQIFSELAANGANYLRIWTCCDDWAMAIESRKSAFGRSWDWHPPIVPDSSGLSCLRISREQGPFRIEPSHPVAVRPATQYLLTGNVHIPENAAVNIQLDGGSSELQLENGRAGGWRRFRHVFRTADHQFWLGRLSLRVEGAGEALIRGLSLRETRGGPELLWEAALDRPLCGFYNPLDSSMLDEVVSAAERSGIYLQLCFLTRNLYMDRLKTPAGPEYDQAISDACKAFRYAVARWGYSTSVAAWEYWNEMDPRLPTGKFYDVLGKYLEQTDPYQHLRTTSTWGPSAKDCRDPSLDLADVHFYLRPVDRGRLEDEVDAVLERTRWLRTEAPNKPAHLGEFGLADDKWAERAEMKHSRELVDFHNALWASALSGASGTALAWWWERLDQRGAYQQYGPLSRFIADIPWNSGQVRPLEVHCSDPGMRVVALQANGRAWLWLFNRQAAWSKIVLEGRQPSPISNAQIEIPQIPGLVYRVRWYDTSQGRIFRQRTSGVDHGTLRLTVPEFTRDLACAVQQSS